jgi:VanZ family protein
MSVIFYYSSQLHPDVPGIDYSPVRKAMHVSEYLLLFVLWWRVLYHRWVDNPSGSLRWALIATIAYAASDELHQHWVGRDGNAGDVLIDSALPSLIWLQQAVQQRTAQHPRHPAS